MIYVDTSAFLRRVWQEAESAALRECLGDREDLTASRLLVTEARRGALRIDPSAIPRVDVLLVPFTFVSVSDAVIESASRLPEPYLRSLDAIHLASALLLGDELELLISYDDRLLGAAAAHDISVAAPGR